MDIGDGFHQRISCPNKSPFKFEGERVGDAFSVLHVIEYPGVFGADNQEVNKRNIERYANK